MCIRDRRLPLSSLQYWIQGIHSPFTRAEKDFNEKDQVMTIRQDGWEIHYSSYSVAQANRPNFPKRLDLIYDSLRIKLIVDEWKAE